MTKGLPNGLPKGLPIVKISVPGETIGEMFGETFAQGLPILFPFIQGLSGRLWGDGERFFRYHGMP